MPQSVFNSLYERWRRMSAIGRIMAIGAVCVSVLYGGGKGENRNVANVGMLPIATSIHSWKTRNEKSIRKRFQQILICHQLARKARVFEVRGMMYLP